MTALAIVVFWLATSCALLALGFRRALAAAWREPVLRAPVLILESDDWGYGPPEQAESLNRIADILCRFRDTFGRTPVMTLGIVLAGPDTASMRADDCRRYHRLSLDDPRLAPVRDAMLSGRGRGVFALQLHGREHYWPDCLVRAAQTDEQVRAWLTSPGFPSTETLPSPLQSRWIDAGNLPSKPLPPDCVDDEATEEVRSFARMLGVTPEVAVPPTFVWSTRVENAWSHAGIRVVVTPGRRSESRDREGRLVYTDEMYYNGATGLDGLAYVVRDSYFEPAMGQTHARAIEALSSKAHMGRPALVETHRMNFLGTEPSVCRALEELKRLVETACSNFPTIRFMNTAELVDHYRRSSDLVETRAGARLQVFLRRLAANSRLCKLAWITGAIVPAWVVYAVVGISKSGYRT